MSFPFVRGTRTQLILPKAIDVFYKINCMCRFGFKKVMSCDYWDFFISLRKKGPFKA